MYFIYIYKKKFLLNSSFVFSVTFVYLTQIPQNSLSFEWFWANIIGFCKCIWFLLCTKLFWNLMKKKTKEKRINIVPCLCRLVDVVADLFWVCSSWIAHSVRSIIVFQELFFCHALICHIIALVIHREIFVYTNYELHACIVMREICECVVCK